MKKVLIVFGTRPEAIKLAPVVRAFQKEAPQIDCRICVTAQHRDMLDQVLEAFNIRPDVDLDVMTPNQDLPTLTASLLQKLSPAIQSESPDLVVIQGDTTTSFVAGLAAYYSQVPVAHVESGLRTGNPYNPFPEELNRRFCSTIASIHFCPTDQNRRNLLSEGIEPDRIRVTGNTVIDALLGAIDLIESDQVIVDTTRFAGIDFDKRMLLVTGHRRESFGLDFEHICEGIRAIAHAHDDLEIVYPVHLNPQVQAPVKTVLSGTGNVHLIEPLGYFDFAWLMKQAYLILTDSGGIQEEAPSLNKPVLVMRKVTERNEALEAGVARLVGTDRQAIIDGVTELLENKSLYDEMATSLNPYGDGTAANKIVKAIATWLA